MAIALAVIIALLALGAYLVLGRARVRASLDLHATLDGWSAAGGVELGPFVLAAAVRDGRVSWALHVFGRRVAHAGPARSSEGRDRPRLTRWLRRIEAADALSLARDAFGRVRVEELRARIRCSGADPATTGRLAAWLTVLSATLAPVADISTEYDWAADEEMLELRGGGRASFIPLQVGWDLYRFVARRAWRRLQATSTAPHGSLC